MARDPMPSPPRRCVHLVHLLVLSASAAASTDFSTKVQQIVGSAKIAEQAGNLDKALAKLDELQQTVDKWRAALEQKQREAAQPTPSEEVLGPPEDGVEFSINKTFVPEKCKRLSQLGSVMKVHYVGKLVKTNKIFATSFHTGSQPFRFVLGSEDVLEAWNKGLVDMCEGERRRLLVPWNLGYGESGGKGVPPYSDLQYDFELVELGNFKSRRKEDL